MLTEDKAYSLSDCLICLMLLAGIYFVSCGVISQVVIGL